MKLPQRKSPRLEGYDYSKEGAYFITICTHERKHYFGEIHEGVMSLSTIGDIAYHHWLRTPEYFPSVELSDYVVMPNHVHLIVYLWETDSKKPTIGNVIGSYKAGVTRRVRRELSFDDILWQGRFHDHIIRNEENLNYIREYVQTNPARWDADIFYDV